MPSASVTFAIALTKALAAKAIFTALPLSPPRETRYVNIRETCKTDPSHPDFFYDAHKPCLLYTSRERLLKLGARVLVSVRRVVVHLPTSFPFLPTFRRVALALGASPG